MAKPMLEAVSMDNTYVPMYSDYVRKLLAHLRTREIPEKDIEVLNEYLQTNCRLMRDEEFPIEPEDEGLQDEVLKLEAELAEKDAQLAGKCESYPELQKRIQQSVMVDLPDPTESEESSENELNAALLHDIKRWQGGVLARRTEAVLGALASTRAQAARLQKAVDIQQAALARGEAAANTPDPTIMVTPPGTPESRTREAFAKRGLTLPEASPNVNVTPRTRRVRRKLSISS